MQVCGSVRRVNHERNYGSFSTTPPLPYATDGVAVREAHPEHEGPAHGTRLPWIRGRSAEWDIESSAVLRCYMPSVVGVEGILFGDRFDDRVQEMAWSASVVGVACEQ